VSDELIHSGVNYAFTTSVVTKGRGFMLSWRKEHDKWSLVVWEHPSGGDKYEASSAPRVLRIAVAEVLDGFIKKLKERVQLDAEGKKDANA
jgi:hypothetical protein